MFFFFAEWYTRQLSLTTLSRWLVYWFLRFRGKWSGSACPGCWVSLQQNYWGSNLKLRMIVNFGSSSMFKIPQINLFNACTSRMDGSFLAVWPRENKWDDGQNETPFFFCRFICVLTNPLMSDDFATGVDNLGFFSVVGQDPLHQLGSLEYWIP